VIRLYLCLLQVTPQVPEFVPAPGGGGTGGIAGARNGSPNFLNSFTSLAGSGGPQVTYGGRRSSLESSLPVSPQLTPQPSPPLNSCSPTPKLDKTPVTPVSTYQVQIFNYEYYNIVIFHLLMYDIHTSAL
jgi:hypothetical protein